MRWAASWAESRECAVSLLAATRRPEVSRSRRCTMPGLSTPPIPERASARDRRTWTRVPAACPGAGCTTIPAGFSTTIKWASWNRTFRGRSSGTRSDARGAGSRTVISSLPLRRIDALATPPGSETRPSSINCRMRERERPGTAAARKRSSRSPASPGGTVTLCVTVKAFAGGSPDLGGDAARRLHDEVHKRLVEEIRVPDDLGVHAAQVVVLPFLDLLAEEVEQRVLLDSL